MIVQNRRTTMPVAIRIAGDAQDAAQAAAA
jgi:hypothetical protein